MCFATKLQVFPKIGALGIILGIVEVIPQRWKQNSQPTLRTVSSESIKGHTSQVKGRISALFLKLEFPLLFEIYMSSAVMWAAP